MTIMPVGGPRVTFSNGASMPVFGLGTWQSTTEEVKNAVKTAVKGGYRLIDTAANYFNEEAIGIAIQELVNEKVVKREDLFITTKAWCHQLPPHRLEDALRTSLRKMQLDYVDLYLAHMPAAFSDDMSMQLNVSVEEIWGGFDHCYYLGLTKAVGVSNWNNDQIARVLKLQGKVSVHNSQVELHLYFPQNEHVQFCKKHNISVTSYATLGSPGRVNYTLPTGQRLDWAPAPSELEDKDVVALAAKYKKTPAQILLKYTLDRGVSIIPKSVNENRIKENYDIFDFRLSTEDMGLLEKDKPSQRLFGQEFMIGHIEDPFVSERIREE